MQGKLLGILSVDFNVTGKLMVIYSALVKTLKKKGTNWGCESAIIDFKKAYDSVRTEVLCNILIDFDNPMKLLTLNLPTTTIVAQPFLMFC
jgi:hypothetical protein